MSDDHAEGHPTGEMYQRRKKLNSSLPPSSSQHPGPFQGHPIPPKGD